MNNVIVLLTQSVPEGRVFALDQQTLISAGIQVLNGIILAVALGFILYKPVKKFMQERTDRIQSKVHDSDSTMAKAKELIDEYEYKIENIDKEYEKVLQEARIKASSERKIIIQEANEEAERIKKRAESVTEAERERIKLQTRPYVIELATLMAQNYISQNIDKKEQEKLFSDALSELEERQWLR